MVESQAFEIRLILELIVFWIDVIHHLGRTDFDPCLLRFGFWGLHVASYLVFAFGFGARVRNQLFHDGCRCCRCSGNSPG